MLQRLKGYFTKTEYVEVVLFNYAHYDLVYGGKAYAHKTSDITEGDSLYQYGTAPDGKPIVCGPKHVSKFFDGKWHPISLQNLDPDAPITSELSFALS